MTNPTPQEVFALRIFLARNRGPISPATLASQAGANLMHFMAADTTFPRSRLEEGLGEYWYSWTIADWMREHPVLRERYIQAKRDRNPSGLTHEDYEQRRLAKLRIGK
jgi:hypothetical protein